jgi:7-keto-8-aminopelargonate synthetase-like enzyme
VLGSRALKAAIISKSRLFVGSTPLPLPLAHAALESLAILKNDLKVRERLARNASYIKDRLGDHQTITAHPGLNPIFPVIPKNPNEAEQLKRRLLSLGIHPPFIKYPGGPDAGYFRFAISSEHTRAQLDALLKALL